jgi:hypothetical protein
MIDRDRWTETSSPPEKLRFGSSVTVWPPFEKLKMPSARPVQRPCTRKLDAFTVEGCTGRSNVTLTIVVRRTPSRLARGLVETTCMSPRARRLSPADSEAAARRLVKKTRIPTGCSVPLLMAS